AHAVVVGGAAQRCEHVDAARTGDHRERVQALVAEGGAGLARGGADLVEVVDRGVEVHDDVVGVVELVDAAGPQVRGDHGSAGHVRQRGGLAGDGVGDGAALLGHGDAVDPVGEVVGDVLQEEAALVHALGEDVEVHGPLADVGQHHGGDAGVVLGQVEL